MARVLITGSSDGLGLAAARTLVSEGHDVVLHARSRERAAAMPDLGPTTSVVIGDLGSDRETRDLAHQVNALGRMDAVIHNAGVYLFPHRVATEDGHSLTFAVNVLAPYLLTALVHRPHRLVYLSSGMHLGARGELDDIDWTRRRWSASTAYSESKLLVATLSAAVARLWPEVIANCVDPGWVPTKMGGPAASDDLTLGHVTQSWLAVSPDPSAQVSGEYWYHSRTRPAAPEVTSPDFQDRLLATLAEITRTKLP